MKIQTLFVLLITSQMMRRFSGRFVLQKVLENEVFSFATLPPDMVL